jgi:hypothetical protein
MRDVTYCLNMITNLNDNEIVNFAKYVIENTDNEAALKASQIILNAYDDGNYLEARYKNLMSIIKKEGIEEGLEICPDCGHTPLTGACYYCKQD